MLDIPTPPPAVLALVRQHNLVPRFTHCDLEPSACCCLTSAQTFTEAEVRAAVYTGGLQDGGICFACGGLTVRTGTCTTCTTCATTGGCG